MPLDPSRRVYLTKMRADCLLFPKPCNHLRRSGIMDDEYRLAWAYIEGWTTNAKRIMPESGGPLFCRTRRQTVPQRREECQKRCYAVMHNEATLIHPSPDRFVAPKASRKSS
jgi:hypothetical protein